MTPNEAKATIILSATTSYRADLSNRRRVPDLQLLDLKKINHRSQIYRITVAVLLSEILEVVVRCMVNRTTFPVLCCSQCRLFDSFLVFGAF
jgi:hypothetical protein